MKLQVGCKNCDLLFDIAERELSIGAQAVGRLRCPYCHRIGEYTAEDVISDPPARFSHYETAAERRRVVCVLSWVPELSKTRKWLLTANGLGVVSLIGTDRWLRSEKRY